MDENARDGPRGPDAGCGLRRLLVRDLTLDADIGVYPAERGRQQPVRINLDLGVLEGAKPIEDRIENVVCYGEVVERIKAVLAEGHVNLVETLAERIAARCLDDPRIVEARVRVEKPGIIAEAASVGVEIERRR